MMKFKILLRVLILLGAATSLQAIPMDPVEEISFERDETMAKDSAAAAGSRASQARRAADAAGDVAQTEPYSSIPVTETETSTDLSTPIDDTPEGLAQKIEEAEIATAAWQQKYDWTDDLFDIGVAEADKLRERVENDVSYWRQEQLRYETLAKDFDQKRQTQKRRALTPVINACEVAAEAAEQLQERFKVNAVPKAYSNISTIIEAAPLIRKTQNSTATEATKDGYHAHQAAADIEKGEKFKFGLQVRDRKQTAAKAYEDIKRGVKNIFTNTIFDLEKATTSDAEEEELNVLEEIHANFEESYGYEIAKASHQRGEASVTDYLHRKYDIIVEEPLEQDKDSVKQPINSLDANISSDLSQENDAKLALQKYLEAQTAEQNYEAVKSRRPGFPAAIAAPSSLSIAEETEAQQAMRLSREKELTVSLARKTYDMAKAAGDAYKAQVAASKKRFPPKS